MVKEAKPSKTERAAEVLMSCLMTPILKQPDGTLAGAVTVNDPQMVRKILETAIRADRNDGKKSALEQQTIVN